MKTHIKEFSFIDFLKLNCVKLALIVGVNPTVREANTRMISESPDVNNSLL